MKIIIRLKSDLCTGNGTGYGSLVDNDTSYDEYGIPFIPGRRIKGLLREAATELQDWDDSIKDSQINRLFGTSGEGFNDNNKIQIYDARISNYAEVTDDINYYEVETKSSVLDYYTYIRYQTAVDENGIAKENSLRSTRVVKRGTVFEAEVTNVLDSDVPFLKKICHFVRHMGLNRTRGYGEVVLSVEEDHHKDASSKKAKGKKKHKGKKGSASLLVDKRNIGGKKDASKNQNKKNQENSLNALINSLQIKDDKLYQLELHMENEVPIVISQGNLMGSIDYINGASILGYFAGQYLKDKNNKGKKKHNDGEAFRKLFIYGDLKFSNAYVSDEQFNPLYPQFISLKKVKDENQYYDDLLMNDQDMTAVRRKNKQLSRVHDQYLSLNDSDGQKYLADAEKELIYHHTRPDDKSIGHVVDNNEGNGAFYQVEAMSPHQHFCSFITGLGKNLKVLLPYIRKGIMTIGKSKDIQYGRVIIKDIKLNYIGDKTVSDSNNTFIAYLSSPAVIIDEKTLNYTNNQTLLKKAIFDALDIDENLIEYSSSAISYTTVGGYNAKWGLPKDQMIAFKQGSVIKFKMKKDSKLKKETNVGINNQEGLGHIMIFSLDELLKNHLDQFKEKNVLLKSSDDSHEIRHDEKLYQYCVYRKMESEVLNKVYEYAERNGSALNQTTLGRLLLMLNESQNIEKFRNVYVANISDEAKKATAGQLFDQVDHLVDQLETSYQKYNPDENTIELLKQKAYKELLVTYKYQMRKAPEEDESDE